jgi:NAD(P)-dependent dehydrogenase (short-subunit alcohol dehydrogenase family)
MRILLVGASGTIGQAIVAALRPRHEVIEASRHQSPEHVDLGDEDSIRFLYHRLGRVDAVVIAAGGAPYKPLGDLTYGDFLTGFRSKLMGQVNMVRVGINAVTDGGSFTLTSGRLAHEPAPGSSVVSLVNAGVEAFARAAALELPRGLRINVVSPPWVSETLKTMGRDPSSGVPAAVVAGSYVASVEGKRTGEIIWAGAR